MHKKLYLTVFTLLLLSFSLKSQLSLVFPKNNYVFDQIGVEFLWNSFPDANTYELQVATDIDFTALVVHETSLTTTNTFPSGLTSNQKYYWRTKANNSIWSEIRTFRIVDFKTWPELEMWVMADSIQPVSGNRVDTWEDLSVNTHDFLQPNSTNQPYLINNVAEINKHSWVEFKAPESNYLQSVNLSSLTKGEVYSFMRIKNSPPTSATTTGLWSFGTASHRDHYPYVDNSIYSGFGRDTRFTVGNVSGSADLRKPHILNISSDQDFNFKINNQLLFTSNLGASSFNSNILLGNSGNNFYLDGFISEILLFNDVLNDSLQSLINEYFRYKYAPPVNLGRNISHTLCDIILYPGKHFASYLWSDGSTADSLVVSNSGTYWVEVEDVFGNISSDTIEVVLPSFQNPTSQLYCPSEFIDWQTGLGEHYNYLWSDGSTADSLVINSPGSYHVTVTDTNGCVFQSDTLVFDEDPFTATASLGPDVNLCTGNNLGLSVGANEAVSYLWNTGATTPEIDISSSGTYNVQVQNANGCIAMDTIDVTIIGDAPNIAFDVPAQSCVAAPFDFEDLSTTTDGSSIIAWDWNFGEGSTAQLEQGNFAYSADGNYDITLTIETSSGCFNTLSAPIEIKTNPMLTFSTSYICQNQNIEFNGGQLSPQTITDWNWNFSDPASGTNNVATGQNTQHVFASPGDYDIMLIGTDIFGCIDTLVQTKTIAPTPTADFNFNEVCEGSVVN